MNTIEFIKAAIQEDTVDFTGKIPAGDHSALASIPANAQKKAKLIVKQDGILAGVEEALLIFNEVDKNLKIAVFIQDGTLVKKGEIAFTVEGSARSILLAERLVLNIMQRMSAIATQTNVYVKAIEGTGVNVLDTRKTTPNFRFFEKKAVRIGGGVNHRFGLYDMVMLKDNHVDFSGGIEKAIDNTNDYLKVNNLDLKIEIETRNLDEVKRVCSHGGVHRIMLDNFSVDACKEAVQYINGRFETEISGGITLETIRAYAETKPDFISVGALTHSYKSMDLSLKAF